ncbi:MAG TPA: class I SAM-dependent methyltransferase [Anaerolineae bacterium]|nr:class I SAM-dependent methyltransferase [Anaerolineae bacterium]
MEKDKVYYLYGEPKSYQETKAFIEWYRRSIRRSFDRHMVIPKHIPLRSYVLDYGCGWGIFSEIVHKERECRVDGIDLSPHSIEIARDFVGERDGLSFSTKGIQEIGSEVYDVVISTEVVEHTHNPGMYLKECNRVLKVGGYLVISLPNIMTPRYILSALMGNAQRRFGLISQEMKTSYDKTRQHIQAWDPTTFCRLVCTMGFEYVSHEFIEGQALPGNLYWRRPWGRLRNLSCKVVFKLKKYQFADIQPYE